MDTAERPGEAKVAELVAGANASIGAAIDAAERAAPKAVPTEPAARAAHEVLADPEALDALLEMLLAIPGAFITEADRRAAVDRVWAMDPERRRTMARCLRVIVLKYGALWMEHAPVAIFAVGCGMHVLGAGYQTAKLRRQWADEDARKTATPAAAGDHHGTAEAAA